MLELTLLLAAGLFLALFFFIWALGQWGIGLELPPPEVAHLTELVRLPGASYERAERLFDARDYRFLIMHPNLQSAARELERERRQAALLWLGLVHQDFRRLERFRSALMACGVHSDRPTEWRLLKNRLAFEVVHRILTLWIQMFGLYAAPRAHTALLASLRQASTLLAALLGRLSPSQLADLKEIWAAQQPSLSLVD